MNSMPFRQLKSFLKILIGVQYQLSEAHPPKMLVDALLLMIGMNSNGKL